MSENYHVIFVHWLEVYVAYVTSYLDEQLGWYCGRNEVNRGHSLSLPSPD